MRSVYMSKVLELFVNRKKVPSTQIVKLALDEHQINSTTMGEPEVVRSRAAALPLTAGRIADPHLPKPRRSGLDVTRFRVVEQFELQPSQRPLKPACRNALREDAGLDEGQLLRHLYYRVVCHTVAR